MILKIWCLKSIDELKIYKNDMQHTPLILSILGKKWRQKVSKYHKYNTIYGFKMPLQTTIAQKKSKRVRDLVFVPEEYLPLPQPADQPS